MATRATTRKEAPSKTTANADTSAEKSTAPKSATDLISPKKKRTPSGEPRPSKSAIPPISRTKPKEQATAQETPPPSRPETVSLIDAKPEKKPSHSGSGETRSVLPPISKIRQPKLVEAEQKVAPPQPKLESPAPAPESVAGGEKIVHIKPPIIVRELALQIGLKPFQLIHDLMEMNIFAAINHTVEPDIAAAICKKHGFVFAVEKREKGAGVHKPEVVIEEPPPPVIEQG
jgi:translation initiation factor IF-2